MARASRKSQSQSVDYSKAENMALGSFLKRLQGDGVEELTLDHHGVRRLFRCISIMRANSIKHLNEELTFEQLTEEHDKSYSIFNGANSDYDNYA